MFLSITSLNLLFSIDLPTTFQRSNLRSNLPILTKNFKKACWPLRRLTQLPQWKLSCKICIAVIKQVRVTIVIRKKELLLTISSCLILFFCCSFSSLEDWWPLSIHTVYLWFFRLKQHIIFRFYNICFYAAKVYLNDLRTLQSVQRESDFFFNLLQWSQIHKRWTKKKETSQPVLFA